MEPITFQVEDMAPHLLDCFVVNEANRDKLREYGRRHDAKRRNSK